MLCSTMHATFQSSQSHAMHYCDVFLDGISYGSGFATTRRDALREAMHNAVDALVRERFPSGTEEATVEDEVKILWDKT